MKRIIIFEESSYMMNRIKNALQDTDTKIYETSNYKELNDLLALDLVKADIIIADIDFTQDLEIELITNYMEDHKQTTFIVTAPILTKKTFIAGISMGAIDYILHTVSNDELERKLKKYLSPHEQVHKPINIILDLHRYLSGELQKANKGNYKLTIAFSTVLNANDRPIPKNKTSLIGNYFYNTYWDTDSLVFYGDNHMLSIFPFCNRETIELVEYKLAHLFETLKGQHEDMEGFKLHTTYATFPEEGISLSDILKIVERKIEKEINAD